MITGRRAVPAALLFAVGCVAIAAAGCGGGRLSQSAYEQKVQAEYTNVQAAFESTRDTSGEQLSERIGAARDAMRAMAEELEAIEPPEQVEHENEELAEGLREYAEQLEELETAAADGRQGVIDRYNAGLAESEVVEEIAEAAEEMKFKGFDLGAIAEE